MILDEILSKFENGEERYMKDPLVHQVVDALISGQDPIVLISQVIEQFNVVKKRLCKSSDEGS